MLIQTETHNVQSNIVGEVHTSKINASPQMFKILSDKLYSNKELAVIRELLSNAYDAHVRAGSTDIPVRIHIPTILEPWFEIYDSGTGLSDEAVFDLYMNYGFSDKTHTNDEIGGFGLGSKSPFCYTDQFTVTSRYNGKATVFQAFIQSNGAPGCVKLGSQPMKPGEHTGLTVHVPIKKASIGATAYNFRKEAANCLIYYPLKFEINGDLEAEIEEQRAKFYEVKVPEDLRDVVNRITFIPLNHLNYYSSSAFISFVMNFQNYTLDSSEVTNLRDRLNQLQIFEALQSIEIFIHLKTGTLPLTPSRESLSMEEGVIDKIWSFLPGVYRAVYDNIQETAKRARNWYEWSLIVENYGRNLDPPLEVFPPRIQEAAKDVRDTIHANNSLRMRFLEEKYGLNGIDFAYTNYAIGARTCGIEILNQSYLQRTAGIIVRRHSKIPYTKKAREMAQKFNQPHVLIICGEKDAADELIADLGLKGVFPVEYLMEAPKSTRKTRSSKGTSTTVVARREFPITLIQAERYSRYQDDVNYLLNANDGHTLLVISHTGFNDNNNNKKHLRECHANYLAREFEQFASHCIPLPGIQRLLFVRIPKHYKTIIKRLKKSYGPHAVLPSEAGTVFDTQTWLTNLYFERKYGRANYWPHEETIAQASVYNLPFSTIRFLHRALDNENDFVKTLERIMKALYPEHTVTIDRWSQAQKEASEFIIDSTLCSYNILPADHQEVLSKIVAQQRSTIEARSEAVFSSYVQAGDEFAKLNPVLIDLLGNRGLTDTVLKLIDELAQKVINSRGN